MSQGSLPFVRASATSRAAAQSQQANHANDEALVLDYIRGKGQLGSTDDEIEQALGLSHQTASARRRGLVLKGFVRDSGQQRLTRTSHHATVWVLGQDDFALPGAPAPRTKRPNSKELGEALENLRALMRHSQQTNGPLTGESLVKVGQWLKTLR